MQKLLDLTNQFKEAAYENRQAYDQEIRRQQQLLREKQQAEKQLAEFEKRKVNSHRETIALFKAKLFYSSASGNNNGKPWYNLPDLDQQPDQAYLALENYIRRYQFYSPQYTHAIFYMRDPEIAANTPIHQYKDYEAFTIEICIYYKNPHKKQQYLDNMQEKINNYKRLELHELASFYDQIYKRAKHF